MKLVVGAVNKFTKLLLFVLLSYALVACNSGGSSTPKKKSNLTPQTITGGGVKGPLANALVSVSSLNYSNPVDFKGAQLASGRTNNSAAIVSLLLTPTTPPYMFEFTVDPAGNPPTTDITTNVTPVITRLRTMVTDNAMLSGHIYATPLTTMAVALATLNADKNMTPYQGDGNGTTTEAEFIAALEVAKRQVLSMFGMGLGLDEDIFSLSPIIDDTTTDAASQTLVARYRTAIEGTTAILYAMAQSAGQDTDTMLQAVINDLADDHQVNGSPAGSSITAAEITILGNPDPGALLIPHEPGSKTVNEVETILVDEKTDTGYQGVNTTPMQPVDPAPAQAASDYDGDTVADYMDNCVYDANLDQADVNTNGIGDICEPLIPVPNLIGQAQTDAESAITAAGLSVGNVTTINSNTVPAGDVISQNPASGDVLSGTAIDIEVSLGPVMVDVPNVIGMSQVDSEAVITNVGLLVGNITTANSASVAVGNVISQNPVGGQAAEGSPVDLVISIGPVMVHVPNVVDTPQAAAEAAIIAANLIVGNVTTANSASIVAGNVISQNPTGGQAAEGSPVDLVISLGPVMVDVPNVVDTPQAAAEAAIIAANLIVGNVTTANSASIVAGNVISQNPMGGQAAEGSAVDLVVSLGSPTGGPDISGIWKMTFTSLGRSCSGSPGNANYLQIIPEYVRYMSIVQPAGGNTVSVTYYNGLTASGQFNNDGTITFNAATRDWTDTNGFATHIDMTLSGVFASGTPDTISGNMVNNTSNGGSSCSQGLEFNAEFVYKPLGTESYDSVYDTEMWIQKQGGFSNRETGSGHFSFTDTDLLIGYFDQGALGQANIPFVSYDRSTGVIRYTTEDIRHIDIDGDGQDDLARDTTDGTIMLVRDPADNSGQPTMVYFNFTSNEEYMDVANYIPGSMPTPSWVDNGIETAYARHVDTVGLTRSNHVPISGSSAEGDFVSLGIFNPPLIGLPDATNARIDVVENASGETVCAATYADRFTNHTDIPLADMSQEAFQQYNYSSISCSVNAAVRAIIDNGSYTVNVRDSSNNLLYSYPITATKAAFATSIPSRRNIDINGAMSSRTQRGDVIDLIGFFNPNSDIPVVVPASTDADILHYRLTFRDPQTRNVQLNLTSASNSFTIPADTLFLFAQQGSPNSNGLQLRLTERYNRSGDIAQAHSRWLNVNAGIRGLVNMEVVDASGQNPMVLQLGMDGSSDVPNSVLCFVTRPYGYNCTASINYSSNQVSGSFTLDSTPWSYSITFSDSIAGTATLTNQSTSETWTGNAKLVNPELSVRSEARYSSGTPQVRTYINFLNPIPLYVTGNLSSASGQDLGSGVSTPVTLWNSDYASQYSSYFVYPLDGVDPQPNGAVISYNTGNNGLLAADQFELVMSNNPLAPSVTKRFTINYDAPNPYDLFTTGNAPPVRADFVAKVNSVIATNAGSFGDPIPVTEGDTIELSWPDVTSDAADTRWQVMMGQVLTSGGSFVPHQARRTNRLNAAVDAELNLVAGVTWTWTSNTAFLQGASNGTSAIVRFHVRASDSANTMRGRSQGVHFLITP